MDWIGVEIRYRCHFQCFGSQRNKQKTTLAHLIESKVFTFVPLSLKSIKQTKRDTSKRNCFLVFFLFCFFFQNLFSANELAFSLHHRVIRPQWPPRLSFPFIFGWFFSHNHAILVISSRVWPVVASFQLICNPTESSPPARLPVSSYFIALKRPVTSIGDPLGQFPASPTRFYQFSVRSQPVGGGCQSTFDQ